MLLFAVLGCTAGAKDGDRCAADAACVVEDAGNSADGPDGDADGEPLDVKPPPPISGGTLLLTRDGAWAVAADPDVDRLSIVGIGAHTPGCVDCDENPRVFATVALADGDEPGRLAEDADGRVHVVLRRGGGIATLDVAGGELLARRSVCPAPRGIVYDASENLLHVACASGELVSLSPLSGRIVRRLSIDVDLRDVVVVPEGLVVSRFKSAELIRIDRDGNVVERVAPTPIERGPRDLAVLETDPLDPAVAWRTVSAADGTVFVLHQYGLARPIDLGEPGAATRPPTPYGHSGPSCGGIVEQTVSVLEPGGALDMGMPMPVLALSVDVAVSSDGGWLVVAHPGSNTDNVTIYRPDAVRSRGRSPVRCADHAGRAITTGRPIALALHPARTPAALADADWLVVQTRTPAALQFFNGFNGARTTVPLEGSSTGNLGHSLFHVDSGGRIACAQCHPEGAEDGRVWQFVPGGGRRTQALHVGLAGTEPFHWEGDLATFEALIDEVYVRRMGGQKPAGFALEGFFDWLTSLEPPPPIVDPNAPPALRGQALFASSEVGCAECHTGATVSKSENVDVGVDSPKAFQIPALVGVGYRAPFLHDGCAETLRDRFVPPCGGDDRHGKTSHLTAAELDDLIAYLESL